MLRTIVSSSALYLLLAAPGAACLRRPRKIPHEPSSSGIIAGDIGTVTFMRDGSTAADAVATIQKNFSENNIKPSNDKDVICQGKTGHVVEFTTGPDGTGVATIPYARSDGSDLDTEIKKSETAFCAEAPT